MMSTNNMNSARIVTLLQSIGERVAAPINAAAYDRLQIKGFFSTDYDYDVSQIAGVYNSLCKDRCFVSNLALWLPVLSANAEDVNLISVKRRQGDATGAATTDISRWR
jgi:hypothetical protein